MSEPSPAVPSLLRMWILQREHFWSSLQHHLSCVVSQVELYANKCNVIWKRSLWMHIHDGSLLRGLLWSSSLFVYRFIVFLLMSICQTITLVKKFISLLLKMLCSFLNVRLYLMAYYRFMPIATGCCVRFYLSNINLVTSSYWWSHWTAAWAKC